MNIFKKNNFLLYIKINRDLKLSNLLITSKGILKIGNNNNNNNI